MKFFLISTLALLSFSSFACFDLDNNSKICPGDKVYKGTSYKKGAMVVEISYLKKTATVMTSLGGFIRVEDPRELYTTKGCVLGVCVGDKVVKGDKYLNGARVIAINHHKKSVTVKEIGFGNLGVEAVRDLDITERSSEFEYQR